ncbi:MAG: TetR/AcrR family transcriptional regulator [Hyphomicrobiales bacterium]
MPRPKQRTPELRARLLKEALATLAEDGVAGFTTRSVARRAQTSAPAVYELFGDKAGLVRQVYFEGFRLLGTLLEACDETGDPLADLLRLAEISRQFRRENPVLAEVMFSRPFADFDPGPSDLEATSAVRRLIVHHVRRCIEAGILEGDEVDIAQAFVALTQGLAAAEMTGRLGTTKESVDRRWHFALNALIRGLRPSPPEP